MKRVAVGVLAVALGFVARSAVAQKTVISGTGMVFRYHGDTIWMDRDSTTTRTIYRGDTVITTMSTNDAVRRQMVYVMVRDSARLIDATDSLGHRVADGIGRSYPATVVGFVRTMLEMELRNADNRARIAAMTRNGDLTEPPPMPETPRRYVVSPATAIIQHRDTVLYLRGCPASAHIDTTTFLMFGTDSVRRLTRPQRTFGQAMALSLTSQMRMSLTRAFLDARQPPLPADLPKAPDPCASAK